MYKSRMKALREKDKLKQNQIADVIKLHRGRYSQYENETDIIPLKHLVTVCNYYNVSIDYIFEFSNKVNYENNKEIINVELSGSRLKELRKDNNLTLEKLASILNCSYGTLAGYESGRYLIATPFLYTICKKYKISADYLLGKIDEPKYL